MKVIRASEKEFVPASHEDPQAAGVLKKVLATRADLQAGQVQMLNWSWLKIGRSFEKHYHEDMQEILVMLKGKARMTAGDESVALGPGDVAIVAPMEVHQMDCLGDEDVIYLVFGIAAGTDGQTIRVS
jgi:quercetin dioxygenase-like cupin family protein